MIDGERPVLFFRALWDGGGVNLSGNGFGLLQVVHQRRELIVEFFQPPVALPAEAVPCHEGMGCPGVSWILGSRSLSGAEIYPVVRPARDFELSEICYKCADMAVLVTPRGGLVGGRMISEV